MSSSTAIPISPELTTAFNTGNYRYIVVKIVNEVLVKHYCHPKGSSLETDWNTIAQHVNGACYVLVQDEPNLWLTITHVPDTGIPIRDKMVYAATKATLLNHLGYHNFHNELHATNNNELSYNFFIAKPVDARSQTEELIERVSREENEERQFRTNQQNQRGIGGYHAVAMPFDASARDKVSSLNGGNNFVELAINATKNGITGVSAKNVPIHAIKNEINTNEPRYYLIKNGARNIFVYCCPAKSPQQLRMVYSTAKGSVQNEAKNLGFNVTKSGEITEGSELTDGYLNELSSAGGVNAGRLAPTRAPTGDGTVKANRQSVIENAHPIYSLMGSPGSQRNSKKIVLPPPGAY